MQREHIERAEQLTVILLNRRHEVGEAMSACVIDLGRTQR
jgi:hypothetical protein